MHQGDLGPGAFFQLILTTVRTRLNFFFLLKVLKEKQLWFRDRDRSKSKRGFTNLKGLRWCSLASYVQKCQKNYILFIKFFDKLKNPAIKHPTQNWMNDFEIGAQVGQGAFGKVFKARRISTNQLVAVKVSRNQSESFKILLVIDCDV